ncbi:unnamed protein product [Diamesa tonsa]
MTSLTNLKNLCRICLGSENEQIHFNDKLDFTCQTICELINNVTNVYIDDEEDVPFLPKQICHSCVEHLRISFNLKRIARESNDYLKDLLKTANQGSNIKKETHDETFDPLIKSEPSVDYFDCSFPDFNDFAVEDEQAFVNTKSATRIQNMRQNAKERSQKAKKAAERRAKETLKQKTERNQREANRIAQKRRRESRIETQEERAIRLGKIAKRAAERRANETPEQRAERNLRESKGIAERRLAKKVRLSNLLNQKVDVIIK